VLGVIGIAFGIAVLQLEGIEGFRGDLAGWLLVAFGLVYFVWGVRCAIRNKPHAHLHTHADGVVHLHKHTHSGAHVHVHDGAPTSARDYGETGSGVGSMTPWILFTVFLFGPCEPLIPLLMYPAAEGRMWGVVLVTGVFGISTLATMTTIVAVAYLGVGSLRLSRYQRYSHALAGLAVLACGAAIQVGL
jgi:hypothetical protein